MKKIITALVTLLCIGVTGGVVYLVSSTDQKAPDITFKDEIVYTEGMDKNLLLKGVEAIDAGDGDVSDSLMVENVKLDKNKETAEVTYIAVDKRNNVAKVVKNIPVQKESVKTEQQKEEIKETKETERAEEAEETENIELSKGEKATEDSIAKLPKEAPQFRLNTYEVTLEKGSKFDYTVYVDDIKDDKMSRSELFKRIQLKNPVDVNVPGTYEVEYFVVDNDGHTSNTAVLTVIIK